MIDGEGESPTAQEQPVKFQWRTPTPEERGVIASIVIDAYNSYVEVYEGHPLPPKGFRKLDRALRQLELAVMRWQSAFPTGMHYTVTGLRNGQTYHFEAL
jgi:hypothetical protein